MNVMLKDRTIEFPEQYVKAILPDGREAIIKLNKITLPPWPIQVNEDNLYIKGEDPRITKLKEFLDVK